MNQTETNLQRQCVKWMRNEIKPVYGTFFSVPNEGKRNPANASKMLAEGLLAGIPDLILLTEATIVLFELKTAKGTIKPKQKLIHKNLRAIGYEVHIIRTFEEFKKIVSCKKLYLT